MMRSFGWFLVEWGVLVAVASSIAAIVDFAYTTLGQADASPPFTMPDDFLAVAASVFVGLVIWKILAPPKADEL